jgi:Ca2+-binding EF-hand superfamily protein
MTKEDVMDNKKADTKKPAPEIDDVEIEPLSDEALEEVAGGGSKGSACCSDNNCSNTQAELESYFLGFDSNKNGVVSRDEFKNAVDKLDPAFKGHEDTLFDLFDQNQTLNVDKDDIDSAFRLGDFDGNGSFDKDEFHTIYFLLVSQVG